MVVGIKRVNYGYGEKLDSNIVSYIVVVFCII